MHICKIVAKIETFFLSIKRNQKENEMLFKKKRIINDYLV